MTSSVFPEHSSNIGVPRDSQLGCCEMQVRGEHGEDVFGIPF
jgi:hypothetical protein